MNIDDLNNTIDTWKNEYNKLDVRYNLLQDQLSEMLKFSEMAIIDCTTDYRIISHLGAFDAIFKKMNTFYAKEKNLISLLSTSLNELNEAEVLSIEGVYRIDVQNDFTNFVSSSKSTASFDYFGKFDTKEIYLLQVKLSKISGIIKAYIKLLSTTFFLRKYEHKFHKEAIQKDKLFNEVMNSINDGVTIIDSRGKITFMNQKAKDYHFPESARILKNAQVEGRFYRDIFTNEPSDEINQRLEFHSKVALRGEMMTYTKKTHEKVIDFEIYPDRSEGEFSKGVIIVCRPSDKAETEIEINYKRATSLVKMLKTDNDSLKERIKELELNQTWLMRKNDEANNSSKLLHESLKQLYYYLEIMPFPFAILDLPFLKYEFVNNSYLNLVNRDKREVIGRKDDQIFAPEVSIDLARRIGETISQSEPVDLILFGRRGKQYLITNENGEPKHIMRVFN